jgi:hypothetical protein
MIEDCVKESAIAFTFLKLIDFGIVITERELIRILKFLKILLISLHISTSLEVEVATKGYRVQSKSSPSGKIASKEEPI